MWSSDNWDLCTLQSNKFIGVIRRYFDEFITGSYKTFVGNLYGWHVCGRYIQKEYNESLFDLAVGIFIIYLFAAHMVYGID